MSKDKKKGRELPAPEMDEINEEQEAKVKAFIANVMVPLIAARVDYLAARSANPDTPVPDLDKMGLDSHVALSEENRRVTAYKFLVARQWDPVKAEEMFRTTCKFKHEKRLEEDPLFPSAFQIRGWDFDTLRAHFGDKPARPQNGTPDVVYKHILPFYQSTFHKWDKWGHPVFMEATGNINVSGLVEKLKQLCKPGEKPDVPMVNYHIHQNEVAGHLVRYQDETWGAANGRRVLGVVVVMDCKGLGMGHLLGPALDILKIVWAVDAAHYPEGLHALYAANCPGMIMFAWNIVKGWLDPRVRGKVQFLKPEDTAEELLRAIDAENLPEHLGGTCKCEGGCIYGLDGSVHPPEPDPSLLSEIINIGSGKKLIKEIDAHADDIVVWEFCVADDRNVEFGAVFVPESEPDNIRELYLPTKSKTMDERFIAPEKGKIVFTFSNEYSWVRSKTLTLRLFIQPQSRADGEPVVTESSP